MDIIKFNNPNDPMKMESGELVNGLTKKTWIERYTSAGEFTFVGPVSGGFKELLPIGCFVSHIKSDDLMIVENHEINETNTGVAEITISGRGFETYLDQRVVGDNNIFPVIGIISDYPLDSEHTWNQAVTLIESHILFPYLIDPSYSLPYVSVLSTVIPTGKETPEIARTFKRGSLYTAVLDLLKIDNYGIRTIRPGSVSPLFKTNPENTAIVVHAGIDRTSTVSFSFATGEVISGDYLWSNKTFKNAALVTGKWIEVLVDDLAPPQYGRRVMFVDGTDDDKAFTATPTGTDIDLVIAAMRQRGTESLASQVNVVLTKAETSKTGVKAIYRVDYGIGDLITVNGDYNEIQPMRVTEYAETEDNTGETGYPTLTID